MQEFSDINKFSYVQKGKSLGKIFWLNISNICVFILLYIVVLNKCVYVCVSQILKFTEWLFLNEIDYSDLRKEIRIWNRFNEIHEINDIIVWWYSRDIEIHNNDTTLIFLYITRKEYLEYQKHRFRFCFETPHFL